MEKVEQHFQDGGINPFVKEKWKRRLDDTIYYWRPEDECIYQLFQQTPSEAVTLSKMCLLDHYYATNIRKKVKIEVLGKALHSSEKFRDLPYYLKKEGLWDSRFSPKTNIYTIHAELTSLVCKKTNAKSWETVFASKWLHFHCPRLFPIIDSRSERVLLNHEGIVGKEDELFNSFKKLHPNLKKDRVDFDKRYLEFCCCLFELRSLIAEHEKKNKAEITPKDLDLYLQTYED